MSLKYKIRIQFQETIRVCMLDTHTKQPSCIKRVRPSINIIAVTTFDYTTFHPGLHPYTTWLFMHGFHFFMHFKYSKANHKLALKLVLYKIIIYRYSNGHVRQSTSALPI